MPKYEVTAETPSEVDALRAMLRKRLADNWPTKPDPQTVATDPVALQALQNQLEKSRQTVEQLTRLAT